MPRDSLAFERIAQVLSPYFRARRMQRFGAALSPGAGTTILDVGGEAQVWNAYPVEAEVTLLNITVPPHTALDRTRYRFIRADARCLPFEDQSFDIAFSNSMIEHLSTYEGQGKAAAEILRVAKRVWVQTPARWFPIETHLKSPLVHYLPTSMQAKLIRHFTLWGWFHQPSREEIAAFLKEVRLLTYREMADLFGGCQINRESFLFLTKSYIAVK